jgi:uncharacterized hydrophobic protein (TIGR00271 family)
MVTSAQTLTTADVQRMRDDLFFEGTDKGRRISRYWLLLPLSAVIAAAGVVSDSTATVIGAMIVAPLMTPILGIVLASVLADGPNLRRSLVLLALGAGAVVAIGVLAGLLVPYPVVAATSSQVAARISPRLVDLVAALATGAVGSVALARSDISDTLPGVAIAISLVPPLAVTGLTLEAGAWHQALGSFLLFVTNVVAILASGIVVMALFRVRIASGLPARPMLGHVGTSVVIGVLLAVVILPLWINSEHFDKANIEVTSVGAVADRWANAAGWSVLGVADKGNAVLVDATGPIPEPRISALRRSLQAAGLGRVAVRVQFLTGRYVPVH